MALPKLAYFRRVFAAYVLGKNSHLTFWHGTPEENPQAPIDSIGSYYMSFAYKAVYPGPFDEHGIPMLTYHGDVGINYNPIAIAQYALGHYNIFKERGDRRSLEIFSAQARWLVENLEENALGVWVWNHHFDWEYRETLKAPWYSALAQGQGLSVLVRAYLETGDDSFLESARLAFESCVIDVKQGGVRHIDSEGYVWLEEYLVNPPTHVLNGFIWALWGIHDYWLVSNDERARDLFERSIHTLKQNLHKFDVGFWSLYEQSGTRLKMMASPFYHRLHIVQLRIMKRLTGASIFQEYADRWERFSRNHLFRLLSLGWKLLFKAIHY